jgi:hypothetical protein
MVSAVTVGDAELSEEVAGDEVSEELDSEVSVADAELSDEVAVGELSDEGVVGEVSVGEDSDELDVALPVDEVGTEPVDEPVPVLASLLSENDSVELAKGEEAVTPVRKPVVEVVYPPYPDGVYGGMMPLLMEVVEEGPLEKVEPVPKLLGPVGPTIGGRDDAAVPEEGM